MVPQSPNTSPRLNARISCPSSESARIADLERALKPFADFFKWAVKYDWPQAIAQDNGTPVLGRDNFDNNNPPSCTVTVGNFSFANTTLEASKCGGGE